MIFSFNTHLQKKLYIVYSYVIKYLISMVKCLYCRAIKELYKCNDCPLLGIAWLSANNKMPTNQLIKNVYNAFINLTFAVWAAIK